MTERLYYADSFASEFEATVTEIQELSRVNGHSLWRLALDRSTFYPTSGGQPHDVGRLVATARSGVELTAEIVDVQEDEHNQIWHHSAKPLQPGTMVRGAVDRDRRLDHIQQHSGQHLLSAAFVRLCSAPTVSFHLGETVSTIDLAVDRLNAGSLQEVSALANRIIAEDRPVAIRTMSRAKAEEWLAAGELRKLPPREGEIRIIEIAGERTDAAPFDRNACGGTHVRSTGQIGGLHLRGMEKVRAGWRVEFVCGLRAVRSARKDFETLAAAGQQLSLSLTEVPEAIERLQAERKQSAKQIENQVLELTRYRAAELTRQFPIENGLRLIKLDLTPADATSPAHAKLLASTLTAQSQRTVAIFAWIPAQETTPATIILSCSSGLDLDCGSALREALTPHGGRGGGTKEIAQGSIPQQHLPAVVGAVISAAESLKDSQREM